MNHPRWRPHLAALLTAIVVSVGWLGLSSLAAWAAGTFTEFPLPSANSQPSHIAAGPDGNLWFSEEVANQIGRITPAGTITEFPGAGSPVGITAGPDGNLWFASTSGNAIGRITPAGVITEFRFSAHCGSYGDCAPHGITAGPDGNLWFTVFLGNFIGRMTTTGSVTEFPIPTANSRSEGITAGPDGNVWFAESLTNKIGRISTS